MSSWEDHLDRRLAIVAAVILSTAACWAAYVRLRPVGPGPSNGSSASSVKGSTAAALLQLGDVHAVDPLELTLRALALVGPDARIASISSHLTNSEGRVDLNAGKWKGYVQIEIDVPIEAQPPPPRDPSIPVGVPLAQPVGARSRRFDLLIREGGLTQPLVGHSDGRPAVDALRPQCSPKNVWGAALKAGVPREALANLSYLKSYSPPNPVWIFRVKQTSWFLVIDDATCKILKSGVEPSSDEYDSSGGD